MSNCSLGEVRSFDRIMHRILWNAGVRRIFVQIHVYFHEINNCQPLTVQRVTWEIIRGLGSLLGATRIKKVANRWLNE